MAAPWLPRCRSLQVNTEPLMTRGGDGSPQQRRDAPTGRERGDKLEAEAEAPGSDEPRSSEKIVYLHDDSLHITVISLCDSSLIAVTLKQKYLFIIKIRHKRKWRISDENVFGLFSWYSNATFHLIFGSLGFGANKNMRCQTCGLRTKV